MFDPTDLGAAAGVVVALGTCLMAAASRRRRRRWHVRARYRSRQTGPYAPTRNVPRGDDLAVAIAEYARSTHGEVGGAHRTLREVGLRPATLVARRDT